MSINAIKNISERLAKAGRELHEQGLVRRTIGNISAKIPSAPSGARMKFLKPEEMVLADLQGDKVRGESNVSLETPIYAALNRAQSDTQAVVHTHVPTATGFGFAKKEIRQLQVEMFTRLPNGVPVVPFELPGSEALAEIVQKKIMDHDAVILENQGVVTVGSTIEAAFTLNEMVEEVAKIQFLAMMLAGRHALNLAKLKEKFKTENTVK